MHALPPEIEQLLKSGQTLEAIKRLRELTGLGLKEAKAAVDARQVPAAAPRPAPPQGPVGDAVHQALQQGQLIEAIRRLREQQPGLGLKEAKDWVEAHLAQHPALKAVAEQAFLERRNAALATLWRWAFTAALLALAAWAAWRLISPPLD